MLRAGYEIAKTCWSENMIEVFGCLVAVVIFYFVVAVIRHHWKQFRVRNKKF